MATAEEYAPEDDRYTSENKWRAIRRGLDARFYDFDIREEKGPGRPLATWSPGYVPWRKT